MQIYSFKQRLQTPTDLNNNNNSKQQQLWHRCKVTQEALLNRCKGEAPQWEQASRIFRSAWSKERHLLLHPKWQGKASRPNY